MSLYDFKYKQFIYCKSEKIEPKISCDEIAPLWLNFEETLKT